MPADVSHAPRSEIMLRLHINSQSAKMKTQMKKKKLVYFFCLKPKVCSMLPGSGTSFSKCVWGSASGV